MHAHINEPILQDIIRLGRNTGLHNLEIPRDDYVSKYWSEVRSLQSELLLAEIKALYRKDLLVYQPVSYSYLFVDF